MYLLKRYIEDWGEVDGEDMGEMQAEDVGEEEGEGWRE
jgi:hypothetical protein